VARINGITADTSRLFSESQVVWRLIFISKHEAQVRRSERLCSVPSHEQAKVENLILNLFALNPMLFDLYKE
jgi:hypothetical protein